MNDNLYYKYRSLNAEHRENTFSIVLDAKIWFARATELMDPFEVVFSFTPESLEESCIRTFAGVHSTSYDEAKIFYNKLISSGKWTVEDSVRQTINVQKRKLLICSLTKDNENILMWSHYASNHRGICIEFCIKDDYNFYEQSGHNINCDRCLYEVEYSENLCTVDLNAENPASELKKAPTRKYCDWKYEKEYRLILMDNGNSTTKGELIPFNRKILTGIFMGMDISVDDKNYCSSICKELGIALYSSKRDPNRYGIIHERVL